MTHPPSEGRLAQTTQTFTGREAYPLVKGHLWDSLDRMKELSYPIQHGVSSIAKDVVGFPAIPKEPLFSQGQSW